MNVATWLSHLGLEQYEQAFRENDVDVEVLRELTADDLIGLGVVSIGHRRKLLAAIAALRAEAVATNAETGTLAERRQLTVMFCDLVGSTALSTQFDPEDLRDIIAAYHRAVARVVADTDGFISRYMGDGVLVYYGYPQAHEDDAERAVRAGLGAVEAVSRIEVKSVKLQARVGIATGLVVVGDVIGEGSSQEQSVVGETPNLAARLQNLAEPDAVVISAGTRRLVGTLFEYRDLGAIDLKGIAGPVPAWQVLRPSVVASRFEALRGGALSRLVGRDEEIDLLMRRWARAKAGDGQVVLVSGEAGLGKSRIAAALHERLDAEPAIRLRYFCSPYHQDSALFPFVDQLGRAAGFAREDPPAVRLEKLEALAVRAALPDDEVAFLADLLSLPPSQHHRLANLSPLRKKERTMEALIRQLEGLARQQPVLMTLRGRALGRPYLTRAARSHCRAGARSVSAAGRDVPPRVPAALDRPAAGQHAGTQSTGPGRPHSPGAADRRRQGPSHRGCRPDRRSHRRCTAVRRGTDQERPGKRSPARGGGSLRARQRVAAVRHPDEFA